MAAPKAEGVRMKGKDKFGTAIMEAPNDAPTLASVGISWKESNRSKELAAVPEAGQREVKSLGPKEYQ